VGEELKYLRDTAFGWRPGMVSGTVSEIEAVHPKRTEETVESVEPPAQGRQGPMCLSYG
jgi:hypothetical protein